MKLAHLILAHNNPLQLERLVRRLGHTDADIYIHLDLKAHASDFDPIKELPGVYFIKNKVKVVWCEYSTIQATLNSMQEILDAGVAYSHINLLSGADYPLKSTDNIQNFLFANSDKSFMWYNRIFDDWIHGQARIKTYYFGEYKFPGRYHAAPLINKILPTRKMPFGLVPYGRSQWLTITPECAAYVLKYITDHKQVKRFFKMTWAVDEVFFQTILCNSPLREKLVNDNLRYIRLQPDFRPVVLTINDAAILHKSGKLFARKFDPSIDTAILDLLDQ